MATEKWHVEDYEGDPGRAIVDENEVLIADCWPDSGADMGLPSREEYQRNARLIAAAPEMVELLRFWLTVWEGEQDGHSIETKALLAKIDGGS